MVGVSERTGDVDNGVTLEKTLKNGDFHQEISVFSSAKAPQIISRWAMDLEAMAGTVPEILV